MSGDSDYFEFGINFGIEETTKYFVKPPSPNPFTRSINFEVKFTNIKSKFVVK